MITKGELSCLGMKQNIENIKEDKYKLMRRSSQNDKLEQLVMHRELSKMRSRNRSSVAINKKFFSTFNCICYTD